MAKFSKEIIKQARYLVDGDGSEIIAAWHALKKKRQQLFNKIYKGMRKQGFKAPMNIDPIDGWPYVSIGETEGRWGENGIRDAYALCIPRKHFTKEMKENNAENWPEDIRLRYFGILAYDQFFLFEFDYLIGDDLEDEIEGPKILKKRLTDIAKKYHLSIPQ